jgi:hypothetical protein
MSKEFWFFGVSNMLYWLLFIRSVGRNKWNTGAFFVGVTHLLFAMVNSVAPLNAWIEPGFRWAAGLLAISGELAFLPAAFVVLWAVTSALLAVSEQRGRWIWWILLGDMFWAINFGAGLALKLDNIIQFGEHLLITGIAATLIMVCLFVLPFLGGAFWSARRITEMKTG